jgi:uncharacterized protein (TIGR03435 family)
MLAYGIQDAQIVGGPSWLTTEKWDIEAKCENDRRNADETRRMLRNLLEERFSLKAHRGVGERSVYVLTVGRGGPKFKESDKGSTNLHIASNSISMQPGSIAEMTRVLASVLGRPVIDRTGLTGLYDLVLQWEDDVAAKWDDAPAREGGVPRAEVSAAPGNGYGSVFTAVQRQLGLRLESGRAPVDVLVIDHIERPSSN